MKAQDSQPLDVHDREGEKRQKNRQKIVSVWTLLTLPNPNPVLSPPKNYQKTKGSSRCGRVRRFGRKPMLAAALAGTAMLGVTSAFASSYTMLAASRALSGMTLSGISIIGTVLGEPRSF